MTFSYMGRMSRDHDANIINLFNVAQKEGLVFNSTKCSIKQDSVTFFGGVFSAKGYSPDPAKIQGITEMTPPQMKQELQSFLGAVNYLQTFMPHLSHHTEPLWAILKKEKQLCLGWEFKQQFPENKVPAQESSTETTQVLWQKQTGDTTVWHISQRIGSMHHPGQSTNSICE